MPALDSNQLKQDLDVIERNIKQLEAKYTDFFEGVTSVEPKEMRAQTETLVNRWWGKPVANTMLRFRRENLVQRYRSYREKWDRQLRKKRKAELEDNF